MRDPIATVGGGGGSAFAEPPASRGWRVSPRRVELYLLLLAILLVLTYAIIPYAFTEILGEEEFAEAILNFRFSLWFAAGLPLLALIRVKPRPSAAAQDASPGWWILLVFVGAALAFHNAPWIEDRESFGASISALFRILWLVTAFGVAGREGAKTILFLILSLILMAIDRSRTFFMLALVPMVLTRRNMVLYGAVAIGAVLALAATRDGASLSLSGSLLYGLQGEGINGAAGVNQVLAVGAQGSLTHLFQTFFQPLFVPYNWVARALGGSVIDSATIFGADVLGYLGQEYPPMGGFYIASEFIPYGAWGMPLLLMYCAEVYYLTKKLFDTDAFPFGSVLFLIAIKSTPYIYWKMVVAILVVRWIIERARRVQVTFTPRPASAAQAAPP